MTDDAAALALTQAAKDKLRQVVAGIEKLQEEKSEVAGAIKDKFAEAKAMGYDTKALRQLIRRRRMDRQEREESDAILETYEMAIDGAEGLV